MHRLDVGPGWVAMMCAFYYINPAGCFLPFCAAIVVHELGHVIALRACGIPIYGLRLNLGGAVLDTAPMDCCREMICALAGPAVNLLCIPVCRWFPTFAMFSLCLAVFNLLPVLPLDGGRALQAALLLVLRTEHALRVSKIVAICFGGMIAALAVWTSVELHGGIWPVLVAGLTLLRLGWNMFGDSKMTL